MNRMVNVIAAISETAVELYKARLQTEREGGEYSGPVSDRAFRILRTMQSMGAVQSQYKVANIGGKDVRVLSLYFEQDLAAAKTELDWLATEYPSNFAIIGAWWTDTGLQVGQSLDESQSPAVVTGDPLYSFPGWAWQLWPDYPDGTPSTSNADLRDITLLYGQAERRFT